MAKLRIRMYRTGFGDCFLLSFGPARSARHILIDFGAHMHGEIGTMEPIMDNIEKETNRNLAVVVASHAHRDHISGFGKFADRFAGFEVGEVWLPWTDDPNDAKARAIQKKQLALYDRLDAHLRMQLGARKPNPQQAAALDALANLRGNGAATSALANGFGTGATVRYLGGGDDLKSVANVPGLSAKILGPSRDKAFLSRMNPPKDQRFLSAPGEPAAEVHPFLQFEMRSRDADFKEIVEKSQQPVVPSRELKYLQQLAEVPADRLALVLDSVRNNTSLVILFRHQSRTLLFPGDAQWGNWQSWINADGAHELLSDLDFLKVAHHGSENATPVDVVSALKHKGLAAMVSTQVKPFPTIPRMPLLAELRKHCGVVMRSDWISVKDAPKGPKAKFPKGGKRGTLWIEYEM